MKIADLPVGKYEVILLFRNNGKSRIRIGGEIVETRDGKKHFITCNPLKRSFTPETVVFWHRKES